MTRRRRLLETVAFIMAISLLGAGAALTLQHRRAHSLPDRSGSQVRTATESTSTVNGALFLQQSLDRALLTQLDTGRAVINLEFLPGSDALGPAADTVLARLARVLAATGGTFLVEAHVTSTGDALADQWLTDRRAAVVRARLVAAGVPGRRLFAMGFGATRTLREPGQRSGPRIELSRMP